ncbi:MAG: KEOPS complex subunit Pcc1 [Fervidicoccaceae archaeon]
MSIQEIGATLELVIDDEEVAKAIIDGISADDEPEGKKIKTKAYRKGNKVIVEMQTKNPEVLTLRNTIEEYLRSIATVINALTASKNGTEKTEKTENVGG